MPGNAQRPERIRVKDELGKLKTPPQGRKHFTRLSPGSPVLVLGLGPLPEHAASLVPKKSLAYFIESPEFKSQMPKPWTKSIPANWKEIGPKDLNEKLISQAEIFVYTPGIRLFPSFWGPVLGQCRWLKTAMRGPAAREDSVFLAGTKDDLLIPEMSRAFGEAEFKVRLLDPEKIPEQLPKLLAQGRPRLFFSINFKGLDPYGEIFHLLDAAGVKVAVWCVDNPFHLISGLKSGFWQKAHLFVTDNSFSSALSHHRAERVHALPLATDPKLFESPKPNREPGLSERMVFVGRSEFPQKRKFFAGCKVPKELLAKAKDMLEQGLRPDFFWWEKALNLQSLWPGNEVRQAGYGAEQCSHTHRTLCLREASALPLTIFGDEAWKELLPEVEDIRGCVDYYGPLPGIYHEVGLVLNVTSLLLPAGLTQRHFDVWAAGGFLITDATPGLDIFPKELVREISFKRPSDIPGLVSGLKRDTSLRKDLRNAWRGLVLAGHTYAQRVETVLDRL